MEIASVNPATGETLKTFVADDAGVIEEKVARARAAFGTWREIAVEERARVVREAGRILEAERERFAALATLEMGKPIRAARDEVTKCAAACRYYAENAATFLKPEQVAGADQAVWFEPLGVVLAVMPWNFPYWQVIRFAAPALTAGNVGLLKHASNVPQCALALGELFQRAGAPAGAFQALLVGSSAIERLIADPRIAAVTLTGSDAAGRAVGSAAGAQVKKSVLELGGSDPFIVLASADLGRAVETAVKARIVNNGQSCIAAKRFIVVDPVYDRFAAAFVERMRALKVGDPSRDDTEVGPLATPDIRKEVARQVDDSVTAGARLLLGGQSKDGPGNYYPPTVLGEVPSHAPAARDEVFGPVAALFRVPDAATALATANSSSFGLAASVWTNDRTEALHFAHALEVGSVFVNDMVASDPRFPFGGVKQSGYGRELGPFGLREFVNVKTVRLTLPT
ncbi:MAG TPA: NAD-dependent succinate-semialdehyde dehydrogenase [Polyangia bacterium]|jgi:succinate-semialdehyde dehydrogenase/glutarate-semialdehyde dehydrogenase